MSDDPNFVPALPRPELTATAAKARLVAAIDLIDTALLVDYPRGEVESFPTQLREAAVFLGLTPAELLAGDEGTPGDATAVPHIAGIVAAETGAPATQATVAAKVASIRAQAIAWSNVRAMLTGIRSRAFDAIAAAEDAAGIRAALNAALADVAGIEGA